MIDKVMNALIDIVILVIPAITPNQQISTGTTKQPTVLRYTLPWLLIFVFMAGLGYFVTR